MDDWNAAMSSEIFREYVKNELIKETQQKEQQKALKESKKNIDQDKVIAEYHKLSEKIRRSPQLKMAFKALKDRFNSDHIYRAKSNPDFVNGVMMLFLDDDNSQEV